MRWSAGANWLIPKLNWIGSYNNIEPEKYRILTGRQWRLNRGQIARNVYYFGPDRCCNKICRPQITVEERYNLSKFFAVTMLIKYYLVTTSSVQVRLFMRVVTENSYFYFELTDSLPLYNLFYFILPTIYFILPTIHFILPTLFWSKYSKYNFPFVSSIKVLFQIVPPK